VTRAFAKLEGRVQDTSYGQAIRPAVVPGAAAAAAGANWRNERGPGRRLGE